MLSINTATDYKNTGIVYINRTKDNTNVKIESSIFNSGLKIMKIDPTNKQIEYNKSDNK